MEQIIFHIDVNSAFLSWTAVEALKNGAAEDLREIPAIIGGDQSKRHGIVLAKSMPAKKYKIQTGEPVAHALRKCPGLLVVPPVHGMYQAYSQRLMDFLRTYTPDIEQVSIDECYMDFTGIAHKYATPLEGARQIKDRIYEKFGFTVNIGISANRLLAKMASDFQKPNRIHTLFPEEIPEKMWPLPVSDLYMAGKSSVEVLHKLEIRTIGELAKADPELLRLHLKSHGQTLWEFSHGIDSNRVVRDHVENKGIGNSTTLPQDLTTEAEAQQVLFRLAESVGKRLRASGQKAGMVSVEIRYYDFQNVSHQRQLSRATASDKQIYDAACELFARLWDGRPIRLLGIRTSKLKEEGEPEQMHLFDYQEETQEKTAQNRKRETMDKTMDAIRKRFGEGSITKGL